MRDYYKHLDPKRDYDYDSANLPWDFGRFLRDLSEVHHLLRRCESMGGMESHDGGVLDALAQMVARFLNEFADSVADDGGMQIVEAWRAEADAAQAAYRNRKDQRRLEER